MQDEIQSPRNQENSYGQTKNETNFGNNRFQNLNDDVDCSSDENSESDFITSQKELYMKLLKKHLE